MTISCAEKSPAGNASLPWQRSGFSWHIITPEYPPMFGGVSDYTAALAQGLVAEGDLVHVWSPARGIADRGTQGLTVHPELGKIGWRDLARVGRALDRFPGPRLILVQWVPHGYGPKAINIGFCCWLLSRALWSGDDIEVMAHEGFLSFRANSWRQSAVALVHRLMTVIWLRACRRVWVSIPALEQRLRPYALGRRIPFRWLPVPSNIPFANNPAGALAVRQRLAGNRHFILGHFGTYGSAICPALEAILQNLIESENAAQATVLLIGKSSESFRERMLLKDPRFANMLQAVGQLDPEDLSYHLQACDLMIQPYPDGVSCRRGTFMAGLSHGKPIVTTAGFLSEPMWKQSDALAAIPVGELKGFVAAILRLQADPQERARMGRAARELYDRCFEVRHTVTSLRSQRA